jgi:hypothetical protein
MNVAYWDRVRAIHTYSRTRHISYCIQLLRVPPGVDQIKAALNTFVGVETKTRELYEVSGIRRREFWQTDTIITKDPAASISCHKDVSFKLLRTLVPICKIYLTPYLRWPASQFSEPRNAKSHKRNYLRSACESLYLGESVL